MDTDSNDALKYSAPKEPKKVAPVVAAAPVAAATIAQTEAPKAATPKVLYQSL